MISYKNIANNSLKNKTLLYDLRRKMVEEYNRLSSYRAVAKKFNVNVKTVIKWVKRFEKYGLAGLKDKKRTPKNVHNKISKELENKIIKLRKVSNFGPLRLKQVFNIDCSVKTIYRVLKNHNLIKEKKKKYKKKNNLREIKKNLKPFQLMQMDIKYLDDIPNFYKYFIKYKLPKYQITIRDVKTGLLYFFYSYEKSVTSTILAAGILLSHLSNMNIDISNITIQTDNGAEFSGNRFKHNKGFRHFLQQLKVKHRFIPPKYPNANAEVESSHNLIENEFYDIEH